MNKCYKHSKKIKTALLFVGFLYYTYTTNASGVKNYPLQNTHIEYLHADQENKIEGNTDEYHFQIGNYSYIFSNVYNKQELYKKRLAKFDKNGNLLNFYERNYKKEIIVFDQFLPQKSVFYKKEKGKKNKLEKFKTRVNTFATITPWLIQKIKSKNLAQEPIIIHTPNTPLINYATLLANCKKEENNPYYGIKEPVFVCKINFQSRFLKSVMGNKGNLIFVFRQQEPHFLLTLFLGDKFYYIDSDKKIKNKENLLENIVQIEKEIQDFFFK